MESKPRERIQFGEGKISGYFSIFLALMGIFGVLCAYFPSYLTTPDFRKAYDPQLVKWVLLGCLVLSFLFALWSFLVSNRRKYGFIAVILIAIAIFMGTHLPEARNITDKSFTVGLDWLVIDLLISAAIFVPIELFLPKRTKQTKFHPEWRTDLIYFIVSHLLIQITGVLVQLPAIHLFKNIGLEGLQTMVQSIPFVLQLFFALFIADLFQYSGHYLFHKVPYLWRFHAVHHSTKHMDWLAGSRTHFFDLVVVRAVTFLPIYVCGFSTAVFSTYIVIVALQAVLAHANTRINFGWLKYVFVTPQYHHWHHADDPAAYNKNFAIHLPLIDMIFGTYYDRGDEWPEKTGLDDAHFPKGFARQLIYPFQKDPLAKDDELTDISER